MATYLKHRLKKYKRMSQSMKSCPQILLAIQLVVSYFLLITCTDLSTNGSDALSKTTAELIRLRGFKAIDHYVTTSDGYILNVVQGLNPLINDGKSGLLYKDPILFMHGILTNGNFYLVNSVGAKPKDYSALNTGNMSLAEFYELLGDDPTSNSLPFTAMNFGHEIWVVNQRGTSQSLGHVSASQSHPQPSLLREIWGKSLIGSHEGDTNEVSTNDELINKKYWNFSLDELAKYDLPAIIDYILERTRRPKLIYVGYSSGSAIPLMALASQPELAGKLSKCLLWAPALYPTSLEVKLVSKILSHALNEFIGPVPWPSLRPFINDALVALCQNKLARGLICGGAIDLFTGFTFGQNNAFPGFYSVIDSLSSHSIVQLLQASDRETMQYYDFLSAEKNCQIYGQETPPYYNISNIRLQSISLWAGSTDSVVPAGSVARIMAELRVPCELHKIGGPGVFFDHISYSIHKSVSKLLIIPSLKVIESQ